MTKYANNIGKDTVAEGGVPAAALESYRKALLTTAVDVAAPRVAELAHHGTVVDKIKAGDHVPAHLSSVELDKAVAIAARTAVAAVKSEFSEPKE